MNAPIIVNMGCRLNIAESAALAGRLDGPGADELVIVNSCAVTNEAVRQTRQAIRRARRAHPKKRIVVTGCAAQIDPAMFADMPETDAVVGNHDKYAPAAFAPVEDSAKVRVSDIMAVRETAPHMVAAFAEHSRAFVEIQNGCDHRCTFCIIPYGRGNSRSVPAGQVVDRIRALVDDGFREVVLTGVDVTSYGPDLPGKPTLGQLIERILTHVPALPRLRLSSLDGIEIDDRMLELLTGEARIMPHLHLSLQAGDDMILKRMKRRHSRSDAIALVERLKTARPDIAIGADIIAGFPTESDAMFENSLKLVDECDIVHGHIFPYSARSGTPAARMPQLPGDVIKARAAQLRAAVAERKAGWLRSLTGSTQQVLVEAGRQAGYAENYARIAVTGETRDGSIHQVRIDSASDEQLTGTIIA